MSSEIIGTKFKYTVDTSHGINQDGFIAIGTESIVYKGLKTAIFGCGVDHYHCFHCIHRNNYEYITIIIIIS